MNILYINHYAGSPEMGMEFRPYYLSREWINQGHNVTIVSGDFSHLRNKNPSIGKDFQKESIDGITYVWIKTGLYEGNGIRRAFSMFRFVTKLLIHSNRIVSLYNPDMVISSSTYPLDTYAAQAITKKANAKYVHEVHDMWPATLYEVGGMSRKHPFVILMQLAENSAYKHCDKCVSLLPYAKEYMVEHGLSANKYINIQNGVVLEEWSSPNAIPKEHKTFFESQNNQFIVGYFGGHALSNALDQLLDIAKLFKVEYPDDNVIFVFVGEGLEKQRLIQRSIDEQINNAFFLSAVEKKAIPELLSHFDVSYMTGLSSPLYRFGLSLNKMYDSMMAGLPVICAFDAPSTLVKEYDFGLQCKPEDYDKIVLYIHYLEQLDNESRYRIGEKGREAVTEFFSYNHLAKMFIDSVLDGE